MGTYSHKLFICPFYKSDRRKNDTFCISCESGYLRLNGRPAFNDYTDRYCCKHDGWQLCTMAAATQDFYKT